MNRRMSERKLTDVNVYVSLPGHSTVCCTASDISEAGIFLKTSPFYMSRLKQLDLVFALNIKSSNVIRMRHVPAVVTRSTYDGVGVAFSHVKNKRT